MKKAMIFFRISLILLAACVLMLTACDGETEQKTPTDTSSDTITPAEPDETTDSNDSTAGSTGAPPPNDTTAGSTDITDPNDTPPEPEDPTPPSIEVLYNEACELLERKEYEAAYKLFSIIGDYLDAKEQVKRFHYFPEAMETVDASASVSFTEQGLPTTLKKTTSNGTSSIYSYCYDKNGMLVQKEETRFYNDSKSHSIYSYTYDSNGNRINMTHQSTWTDGVINSSSTDTYDYVYDKNGNLIQVIWMDSELPDKAIWDHTYDKKGDRIKTAYTKFDGEGKIAETWSEIYTHTYDENGNKIRIVETYSDGGQTIIENIYDEEGNLIKVLIDGTELYSFTYDEKGNPIQEIAYGREIITSYKLVYVPYDDVSFAPFLEDCDVIFS